MALDREPRPTQERLRRVFDIDYPLTREDVLWALEYMKKKVADEGPLLLSLPQPQLLRSFQCFAEVSMMLLHQRSGCGPEADRLRGRLTEALAGLRLLPDQSCR